MIPSINMNYNVRILVCVADIGYGPVCTTLPILRALDKLTHGNIHIIGLGKGLSEEQCLHSGLFDKFITCDLKNKDLFHLYKSYFLSSALIISNSSLEVIQYAHELGKNTVMIDILPFMHSTIPAFLKECSLYLYQDFFGSDRNLSKNGFNGTNIHKVAPLLSHITRSTITGLKKHHVIVSLGGGTFAHHLPKNYQKKYLDIVRLIAASVRNVLEEFGYSYGFYSGSELAEFLTPLVKINQLPHHEFVSLLSNSERCILAPGLTGMYECIALDITPLLLPPLNHSQVIQLKYAIRNWNFPSILDKNEVDELMSTSGVETLCNQELWNNLWWMQNNGSLEKLVLERSRKLLLTTNKRSEYIKINKDGAMESAQEILKVLRRETSS